MIQIYVVFSYFRFTLSLLFVIVFSILYILAHSANSANSDMVNISKSKMV